MERWRDAPDRWRDAGVTLCADVQRRTTDGVTAA